MILFLVFFWNILLLRAHSTDCIPAKVEVTIKDIPKDTANYVRLDPYGKYMLITHEDQVSLYVIQHKDGRYHLHRLKTPLQDEPYPVEPEWKYISSTGHSDLKAHFYLLDNILDPQNQSDPILKDTHNQYYHSIGSHQPNQFRVVNWSHLATKDYAITEDGITPKGKPYRICSNLIHELAAVRKIIDWKVENPQLFTWLELALKPAYRTAENQSQLKNGQFSESKYKKILNAEITKMLQRFRDKKKISRSEYDKLIAYHTIPYDQREGNENPVALSEFILAQPIIDPRGQYIAGMYQKSAMVFRINKDHSCSRVQDLEMRTSKVSFGYNGNSQRPPDFVFAYSHNTLPQHPGALKGIGMYEARSRKVFELNSDINGWSYPNLTKDGRVFYLVDSKLYIMDPHQITNGAIGTECVTKARLKEIYRDKNKNGSKGVQ